MESNLLEVRLENNVLLSALSRTAFPETSLYLHAFLIEEWNMAPSVVMAVDQYPDFQQQL
jgi:hypothetical protein